MTSSQTKQGFTLIELIIVIVILGILAVVAVPRFINLSTDAKIATMDGLVAAMQSALSLTVNYAQLKRIPKELNQDLTLPDGKVVRLDYGFPEHTWENSWSNILEGSFTLKTSGGVCDAETDWCVDSDFNIGDDVTIAGSSSATVFWLKGVDTSDNCYVYYAFSASSKNNVPSIGKVINKKDTLGNVIPGSGC